MLFQNITTYDAKSGLKENQYVLVDGQKISYVGDTAPEVQWCEIYDGKGKLLMPGFFNAHAHSPMTLLRGYGENLSLSDWLNKRIFPFEAKLDSNAVYWGTLLSMAESMMFGIVSSTDMYYFCSDMAKAIAESGMKANIGRAIAIFSDEDLKNFPSFIEAKKLYEEFNGAENGRILIDMSLHAEYTSTSKAVAQLAEYTKEIGARMHVHVSETKAEHEECKGRHNGQTPVEYLSGLGLFDTPTTAAHCVWVTESDMEIMAKKGVTVASCPVSNMKLASGVCDVPTLMKKGVAVAIGTDSVASNNSLNYVEEMKFFALGNKVMKQDPTLVTPVQTLEAATLTGALSQGRTNSGVIEKDGAADLIVMDISGPHMQPVHNMENNLVYSGSGSDVVLTMVDGKVLYRDHEFKTIDIEKAIYETNKAKEKILGEL